MKDHESHRSYKENIHIQRDMYKNSAKVYIMKVTVHDIQINCPKHGKVPYTATSNPGGEVITLYCPRCEDEARKQHLHQNSPYPLQGTSPSVIESCNRGD